MSDEKNDAGQDSAAPRRKRKGRLRRRLVILLLVLAALIWAGPYLASTGVARDMIVSAVNSRIYGTVQIDEISLNWLGPCVVKGLRVTDTSDRKVLHVEQIIWEHGAWRGITGYEKIGLVEVVNPEPTLIVGPDGKISLTEALKLRKPSEKKPLPELFGRITVQGGNVSVVLANGTRGELSGLDARFDLNTLKDVAGEFSWDSFKMYDLVLGEAIFKPTFRNERLDLPVEIIPVSTVARQQKDGPPGCLRVGCEIDFSGPEPVLKMPGTLKVAENIPINRELGSEVLSRVVTIFFEPKELTGRISSLTVEDLNVPLGENIKDAGGRGRAGLKDVEILSDGLMSELTKLGGLAPPSDLTKLKISGLIFEIRDERFYYDDLAVTFAGTFDMKFSGWVGFDDSLDLIVTLPITLKQFEQFVGIVTLEKFRSGIGLGNIPLLGNVNNVITSLRSIRIVGTRQEPKLGLPPVLDPLLKPKSRPVPQPTTKPKPAGPLFDLLDGLLKPKPAK